MGNIVKEKSFEFGIAIVKTCLDIQKNKKEFDISRQVKRSGTAVGALIRESEYAESKKDFIHKLHIALKEANETDYWLHMLVAGELISKEQFKVLEDMCNQLIRLLISIIKKTKENLSRKTTSNS